MDWHTSRQNTKNCFTCGVGENCIFSNLDRSHLAEIERIQQRRIYPAGTTVFRSGDQPQGVYIICFGRVKLSVSSSDGRRAIVGIATAGDILGVKALLAGEPHNLKAKALELTQLCFIEKNDFLDFLKRNGGASLGLAQKLSKELYRAYTEVRDMAFKEADKRLAELLVGLCQSNGEQTPKGIRLNINLSWDEVAEMVGTSRRTLTRALTKLRHLGLIEYKHHSIIILNMIALGNILLSKDLF